MTSKHAVEEGLAFLKQQDDIEEAEVYVSANGILLTRLNYTSHIPCNGVEEPKSVDNYGIGVQAVFGGEGHGRPHRLRLRDLRHLASTACVRRWTRPARALSDDPEFVSLARPTGEKRTLIDYADPTIMDIKDEALAEAGWRVLNGGLRVFETSEIADRRSSSSPRSCPSSA